MTANRQNRISFLGTRAVAALICLAGPPALSWGESASITLDGSVIIAERPILGGNEAHFYAAAEFLDGEGNFTPDAVDAGMQVECEMYRFPGGSILMGYDWKRSIGPQEERIDQQMRSFPHVADMNPERGEWGPDEAARYANLTSGTLVVGINSDLNATDAADYLEYMNAPNDGRNPNGGVNWAAVRAANGHPEPYYIRHWEIANESGGRARILWPNYPASGDYPERDGIQQGDPAPTAHWRDGGTRTFTNQRAVRKTGYWWFEGDERYDFALEHEVSKGRAFEEYYVKFPPVAELLEVRVGQEGFFVDTWTATTDWDEFRSASPNAEIFYFEPETGRILFGDGINAKRLTNNYNVWVDYVSGPHDGIREYERKMRAITPDLRLGHSHFTIRRDYNLLPGDIVVDGFQEHGGSSYANNNPAVSSAEFFEELIGRGYFSYNDHIQRAVNLYQNNGIPPGPTIFQTELALGHVRTWDSDLGIPQVETIKGSLNLALMIERAITNFGWDSIYPLEMFMITNFHGYGGEMVKFDRSAGKIYVTSLGRAMELFTRHFGRHVLAESSHDLPTWEVRWNNSDGDSFFDDIPKVVPLAALTDSGDLTILAINTTESETITLDVGVENSFALDTAEMESWTLLADNLNAINSYTEPDRVRIIHEEAPQDVIAMDAGTVAIDVAPATIRVIRIARHGIPDTIAPAAPHGLNTVPHDGHVKLQWADNRERDLSHYDVYRRATPRDTSFTRIATGMTVSGYVDGETEPWQRYDYFVRAVDRAGNESEDSVMAMAIPRPEAATALWFDADYSIPEEETALANLARSTYAGSWDGTLSSNTSVRTSGRYRGLLLDEGTNDFTLRARFGEAVPVHGTTVFLQAAFRRTGNDGKNVTIRGLDTAGNTSFEVILSAVTDTPGENRRLAYTHPANGPAFIPEGSDGEIPFVAGDHSPLELATIRMDLVSADAGYQLRLQSWNEWESLPLPFVEDAQDLATVEIIGSETSGIWLDNLIVTHDGSEPPPVTHIPDWWQLY